MTASYSASEFRALLDGLLPAEAFREGGAGYGKVVWLHAGNLWTLAYGIEVGSVKVARVSEAKRLVDISLFREGVVNIEAVLKAVGALSD